MRRRILNPILSLVACVVAVHSSAGADPCGVELRAESVLTLEGGLRPVDGALITPGATLVLSWSAYDPRSRRAIRELDAWRARWRKSRFDVRVVALATLEYREPPRSVAAIVEKTGVRLPVFVDGRGAVTRELAGCAGVSASIPSVFAVVNDGEQVTVERVVGGWGERSAGVLDRWLDVHRAESEGDAR